MNNRIFYGPPGTGKTYSAKKNAIEVVWETVKNSLPTDKNYKYYNPKNFCELSYNYVLEKYVALDGSPLIRFVSMHEGLTPSDLLEGLSVSTKHGNVEYFQIDKTVIELIEAVRCSDKPGILILDDIHRVNLVGVIGELFYAFTHRNESVTLSTGRRIQVPDNLHVFLTMNSLIPQYPIDADLLNGFELEQMKNDRYLLIKSLNEWIDKKLYFNDFSKLIDQINEDKNVITEKLSMAQRDGNSFTELFKSLISVDYHSYLCSEQISTLSKWISMDIEKDKTTAIWGQIITKPTKNNDIKVASSRIYDSIKRLIQIRVKNERYIQELKTKAVLEWDRYNGFVVQNVCSEYESVKDLFTIGYTYFLPPDQASLEYSKTMLTHKVRGQILPLIKQYVLEGILVNAEIPQYETTATRYSLSEEGERISFPYLNETQVLTDLFEDNLGNWQGLYYPPNTKIPFNANYCLVFSIVKDYIDAHIISDWQVMDILCHDRSIMQRKSKDYNVHSYIGCYLAPDYIAATIKAGDKSQRKDEEGNVILKRDGTPKTSGNEGLPAYSPSFHTLVFRNKKYYFFHKISNNKGVISRSVDECRERFPGKRDRKIYPLVKVLIYDLIKKYEENLNEYLIEDNIGIEDRLELEECLLCAHEALEYIDNDLRWEGEPNYQIGRLNLLMSVRNMDFWQRMKSGQLKGVYMIMDERYQTVMDATGIHQMILQGPPGTSKTYGAKEFLAEQMGIVNDGEWDNEELENRMLVSKTDDDGNDVYELPESIDSNIYWDIIQFHPSYTYEDFVRGITVQTVNNHDSSSVKGSIKVNENTIYDIEMERTSSLQYKTVNKALGKIARIARREFASGKKFYLIIDEINRANLATVFGELIYALEYRDGKGVSTPYYIEDDENIIIPNNLYIIGTMNTADKSIASIDYAIRRRFLFFPTLPSYHAVYKNVGNDCSAIELKLFYLIQRYFLKYYNSDDYDLADIQIGHTFFLRKNTECSFDVPEGFTPESYQMKLRFIYQVIPVLREYRNDGIIRNDANSDSENEDFSELTECFTIIDVMIDKNDPDQLSENYNRLIDAVNRSSDIVDSISNLVNSRQN